MATTRTLKGGYDLVAKIMAVCFSLFYLYTTFFGLISQESHIGIYVLGTFALSFMLYKARKDSPEDRASFIDILIIIGMIIITVYYIREYPTLADRIGGGTALRDVIFGWILILVSLEAARRVVGKIVEANHTPGFWNIVRAQAPTMDKAKAWLKENGQLLEEAI